MLDRLEIAEAAVEVARMEAIIKNDKASAKDVKEGLLALNKAYFSLEAKDANTLTVKAKAVKASKKTLKKKAVKIKAAKAVTVSKLVGKVTYSKAGGSNKIAVASNGNLTVKKKTKKGTYSEKSE